jgi:hypothetical protein
VIEPLHLAEVLDLTAVSACGMNPRAGLLERAQRVLMYDKPNSGCRPPTMWNSVTLRLTTGRTRSTTCAGVHT